MSDAPVIHAIRATPVEVPMRHALGTSQAAVRAAPLLLIDLETEDGPTGRAYLFCYVPAAARAIDAILREVERLVRGEPVAPLAHWQRLSKRFTLIGVQGVVRMALAGFDVAAWDVLARAAGKPLASLLGALKLRLGYPSLEEDIAAVRAVRSRLPEGVALMVDYNQALSVAEALRRGRALDAEGIYWLEEPIRHDDYRGCARIAAGIATPVQIGENFGLPSAMEEALACEACDFVMPDLERIGGVTGWQRAAAIASARGVEMSSHLFPEVSAHLLAATPTAHWLEYVDWAAPLLAVPMRIEGGMAHVAPGPGNGLAWDDAAVARYRMA